MNPHVGLVKNHVRLLFTIDPTVKPPNRVRTGGIFNCSNNGYRPSLLVLRSLGSSITCWQVSCCRPASQSASFLVQCGASKSMNTIVISTMNHIVLGYLGGTALYTYGEIMEICTCMYYSSEECKQHTCEGHPRLIIICGSLATREHGYDRKLDAHSPQSWFV